MKILILSLYYPPLNNIAASRVTHFEKSMENYGFDINVITRHYDHNDVVASDVLVGMQNTKEI